MMMFPSLNQSNERNCLFDHGFTTWNYDITINRDICYFATATAHSTVF